MYGSFYGWYLKCQSTAQTLAVIPAVHQAGRKRTCSIQIIADNGAWTIAFPSDAFRRTGRNIFIKENRFGEDGLRLAVHTPEVTAEGRLEYVTFGFRDDVH